MKIRFVVQNNLGSSFMRAFQVKDYLKEKGFQVDVTQTIEGNEDNILVFVKSFDPGMVVNASEKNLCIFDPVDVWCRKDYLMQTVAYRSFHAVFFPTEMQLNYFGGLFNPDSKLYVVPHHFDPRVQSRCEEFAKYPYSFRLGYIGASFNHLFKDELADVLAVHQEPQWADWAPFFTCHYSVRKPNSPEALFKPATKVSTAAAVNANIITTRDADVVQLLGDGYPYYVDDVTPEGVFKVIKRANDTFGDELWYDGLKIMKEARERTSLEAVGDLYAQIFTDLGAKNEAA